MLEERKKLSHPSSSQFCSTFPARSTPKSHAAPLSPSTRWIVPALLSAAKVIPRRRTSALGVRITSRRVHAQSPQAGPRCPTLKINPGKKKKKRAYASVSRSRPLLLFSFPENIVHEECTRTHAAASGVDASRRSINENAAASKRDTTPLSVRRRRVISRRQRHDASFPL